MDRLCKRVLNLMNMASKDATYTSGQIYKLVQAKYPKYKDDEIRECINFLIGQEYLAAKYADNALWAIWLAHKGKHFDELQKIEFWDYVKSNWVAILALIVSVIALIKS